jgi:hypothetical protein
MSILRRVFNYVNGRQIFTMPKGFRSRINFHAWGGGGGGGGDAASTDGGNGSAGSYVSGSFLANPGDRIEVVVGGGGSEGQSVSRFTRIFRALIPGASELPPPAPNPTSPTFEATPVDRNPACADGPAYGWYTRSGGEESNPTRNVKELVIRWDNITIFRGPVPSLTVPFVSGGFEYYPSTYRGSQYGWCVNGDCGPCLIVGTADFGNAFDIYRRNIGTVSTDPKRNYVGAFGSVPNPTNDELPTDYRIASTQRYPVYVNQLLPKLLTGGGIARQSAVWPVSSSDPVDVAWDNDVYASVQGRYRIEVSANVAFRIIVDNRVLINITARGGTSLITRDVNWVIGNHVIRVEARYELQPRERPRDPGLGIAVLFVPDSGTTQQRVIAPLNNRTLQITALQNMVWNTRLGTTYELTPNVPVIAAPLVGFYLPDNAYYQWGIFGKSMAFLNSGHKWTAEELARFNLTPDQCILITDNVTVSCTGRADSLFISGYYRFSRGETWDKARYNWIGNPQKTASFPNSLVAMPTSWIARQIYSRRLPARFPNNRGNPEQLASWVLSVPPPDQIFIVGFIDGPFINNTFMGSDSLTWSVSYVSSPLRFGGEGGRSALSQGPAQLSFSGGYGSGVGVNANAGGGGGGGGASLITITRPNDSNTIFEPQAGILARWYETIVISQPSNGLWYNNQFLANSTMTIRDQSTGVMPSTGKNSVAFNFLTNNGDVFLSTIPALNLSGIVNGYPTSFTLEAWVYASAPGNSGVGGIIINKDFEYEVARFADGRICIAIDWGQGAAASLPGGGWMYTSYFLPLLTPALISVVFEGDDCRLYVNGVFEWGANRDGFLSGGTSGTRRFSVYRNTPLATNRAFYVGGRPARNQQWRGFITDVRVWGVARTQEQIAASIDDIRPIPRVVGKSSTIALAGGGGGGGGAGSTSGGGDATADYEPSRSVASNSGTGQNGNFTLISGGGGGGGGGGLGGGRSGDRASIGGGPGPGGTGGAAGGSDTNVLLVDPPTAYVVMVGRGGNGGNGLPSGTTVQLGGGGGGGGEVVTGTLKLDRTQLIEIGGAGDRGGEWEGVTSIHLPDIQVSRNRFGQDALRASLRYVTAGPGGKGAGPGGTTQGQPGGCVGNDLRSIWGGSGGGGGGAVGAVGKRPLQTILGNQQVFSNAGGLRSGGAGGGGGSLTAGQRGQSSGVSASGGNGGAGRPVPLGPTGIIYTLGAGGGGAAARGSTSSGTTLPFGGIGGAGGGGDGQNRIGSEIEYTKPGNYRLRVPPGVTTMYFEGVAAGGRGGPSAPNGGGGGGSGGWIPSTAYSVVPLSFVSISMSATGNTTIRLTNTSGAVLETITLTPGRQGRPAVNGTGVGGLGGSPNSNQGEDGNQLIFFTGRIFSGAGADSPYGFGGGRAAIQRPRTTDVRERPGSAEGFGAGGGGGANGFPGGLGSGPYVKVYWEGEPSINAVPSTGSGGGGSFEGTGGEGGTGFCAIAYAGDPLYNFVVGRNRRVIPPRQYNGWTIHECTTTGTLELIENAALGEVIVGEGATPAGTDTPGYTNGSAVGGYGRTPSVFPASDFFYPLFLQQHGVWEANRSDPNFERSYQINFPTTKAYQFTCYVENGAQVFVDDGLVMNLTPPERDGGTYWWTRGSTVTRTITRGTHKISWRATSLNDSGSFGLTVVDPDLPTNYVFDSRRPPGAGSSGNGGNGLVVMEFSPIEGTALVKQVDAYRKITATHVKVSDAWKEVDAAWVKVQDQWKPLFGVSPFEVEISTDRFGNFGRGPFDVICISVIDECSQSLAVMSQEWNTFLSRWGRSREFWLLAPANLTLAGTVGGEPIYTGFPGGIPQNFTPSNNAYLRPVRRDSGSAAPVAVSDWFSICGLEQFQSGQKIALTIDISGSMTRSTVSASISLFLNQCRNRGFSVVANIDMTAENWVAPLNRPF